MSNHINIFVIIVYCLTDNKNTTLKKWISSKKFVFHLQKKFLEFSGMTIILKHYFSLGYTQNSYKCSKSFSIWSPGTILITGNRLSSRRRQDHLVHSTFVIFAATRLGIVEYSPQLCHFGAPHHSIPYHLIE